MELSPVPELHIDIIFGFMFNIREIALTTYRVVLSFTWFPLTKDRHGVFTVVGLDYGKIMGVRAALERVLADRKGELIVSKYW